MRFKILIDDSKEFKELVREIGYSTSTALLEGYSQNLIARVPDTDMAVVLKNRDKDTDLNDMDFEELNCKIRIKTHREEFEKAVTHKNIVITDSHLSTRGRKALDKLKEQFVSI